MFIALLNEKPSQAYKDAHKGAEALCPTCRGKVIARVGEQKIAHWAHDHTTNCANGQGEGEWHYTWKGMFLLGEVEFTCSDWPDNRADVAYVADNLIQVIELQQSPITSAIITTREAVYHYTNSSNMVWIVNVADKSFESDGPCDKGHFTWKYASQVWEDATAPVFFDTGHSLVYWHRIAWSKTNDEWVAYGNNDIKKQQRCTVFPRPTNAEELREVVLAGFRLQSKNDKAYEATKPQRDKLRASHNEMLKRLQHAKEEAELARLLKMERSQNDILERKANALKQEALYEEQRLAREIDCGPAKVVRSCPLPME